MRKPKTDTRFSHRLTLRVQPALPRAIDFAAAKRFTTPSAYIRQALVKALRDDKIDPKNFSER
jgi:predicted HicB family RNase H-like nuclease